MAKKLSISFKENDKEIQMYLDIKSRPDASAFVKEALQFYKKYAHYKFKLEELEEEKGGK